MVKGPEVLAIIPARGKSKGLPGKNVRFLAGHPLIAWSIAAAHQSQCITRCIVSTDDEDIAAIAERYCAEVPFLRPEEYASDQSLDIDVFTHALKWLEEEQGYKPDTVVQLRPTSPLRPGGLIEQALKRFYGMPDADSLRCVIPSGQNPYKMWRLDPNTMRMSPLLAVPGISEAYNEPRQKLPKTWWQTGHLDIIRPSVITEQHSMSGSLILGMEVPAGFAVDIDTLSDLQMADSIASSDNYDGVRPKLPTQS